MSRVVITSPEDLEVMKQSAYVQDMLDRALARCQELSSENEVLATRLKRSDRAVNIFFWVAAATTMSLLIAILALIWRWAK